MMGGGPYERPLEERLRGLGWLIDASYGMTVLDLGCAEGMVSAAFKGACVVGVEIDPYRAGKAREKNIPTLLGDAEKFKSGLFDIVLLLGVAHHTNNPEKLVDNATSHTRHWLAIRGKHPSPKELKLVEVVEGGGGVGDLSIYMREEGDATPLPLLTVAGLGRSGHNGVRNWLSFMGFRTQEGLLNEGFDTKYAKESLNNIYVIRDILNWAASRFKNDKDVALIKQQLPIWRDLAGRENLILFERWHSNEVYRRDIVNRLNSSMSMSQRYSDVGKDVVARSVPQKGIPGSSFDGLKFEEEAYKMNLMNRWGMLSDEEREILRGVIGGEVIDINSHLFGGSDGS